MITQVIFWVDVFLLLYTYVGYPCLIALLAHLRPQPVCRGPIGPSVSLLIVAHNEALVIREKLENCLTLDYPKEKLEILLASDGSADATVEIARGYEPQGVVVIEFETRRGKPAVLNEVIPRCSSEIVVLSDARQLYERLALLALVENFADPSVGAVSGELHLTNEGKGAVGEGIGAYWQYEKFIRRHESQFDSTVGTTGAIYAIRRDLFEPIADDTLLDDVLIPMRIVRRGFRVVFEPGALAFDRVAETAREEYRRKVRTITGNLQLFAREWWLWSVRQNRLWFQAISHKVLRIVGPFLLGIGFTAALSLAASSPIYWLTLVAQLLFYGAALGGFLSRKASGNGRWLGLPYAFCLLNLTALVGVVRFLTGGQRATWDKATDLAMAKRDSEAWQESASKMK